MRAFKTKEFARSNRKSGLDDKDLCEAVERAERGLIDGELGKFLVKQRIARPNKGRSGGHRAIIVYKKGDLALFLHIFPKNQKANLTPHEEETFRDAAKHLANIGDDAIEKLVSIGEWIRIDYEQNREGLPERSAQVGSPGDGGPPQGRRDRQGDDEALRPGVPDPSD